MSFLACCIKLVKNRGTFETPSVPALPENIEPGRKIVGTRDVTHPFILPIVLFQQLSLLHTTTTMVAARPVTPTGDEDPSDEPQKPTPVKEIVRTATRFSQDNKIDITQRKIFKWAGVRNRTGYRMIAPGQGPRRHHNSPWIAENRGRKPKITNEDFEKVEEFVLAGGFEHRVCN